jgi:hypothetical protein
MMCARVRQQFAQGGTDAVLNRMLRATPPVPPIFDGEKEAKLTSFGLLATSRRPREMDAALAGTQSRRTEYRGSCKRQYDWARAKKTSSSLILSSNG